MDKFSIAFPAEYTLLPVIHTESEEQGLLNAQRAQDAGADGVFLINHDYLKVPATRLIRILELISSELPGFWVGLNCLDLDFNVINVVPKDTPGLWLDHAGINMHQSYPVAEAQVFANMRDESLWDGLYFGGVAFKGQRHVYRPQDAALLAVGLMDVITTSGVSTGQAPDIEKICMMANIVGSTPLAIASGITPENVEQFMPYARCFLVATGISSSETELDPVRMRELAKILGK